MNNQNNKILVVEDSPIVSKIIRHVMATEPGFVACYADSFASAKQVYEEIQGELFAALVDLNLPDAPDGEVVDYLLDMGVPVVVLTGSYEDGTREDLLDRGIIDYVTKEGRYSYLYALNMLRSLQQNQSTKVLVVDDSATSRHLITDLLRNHQFIVMEAENGADAIRLVLEHPDIKLLITDYNMPTMDGFELVQALRGKYEKTDMAIIGLSSEGQSGLSAKFIKNGANDFLAKPFCPEEFYCRVNHNLEALRQTEKMRDLMHFDSLTGLLNRKAFLSQAQGLLTQSIKKSQPVAAAICNLQKFTRINFQHGIAVGDEVLKYFARHLQQNFARFLLGRCSADAFYLLMPGLDNHQAQQLLQGLQQALINSPFSHGDDTIPIVFNAGVTNRCEDDVSLQFLRAEAYLRKAQTTAEPDIQGDGG